jgi:hypothetical protein
MNLFDGDFSPHCVTKEQLFCAHDMVRAIRCQDESQLTFERTPISLFSTADGEDPIVMANLYYQLFFRGKKTSNWLMKHFSVRNDVLPGAVE